MEGAAWEPSSAALLEHFYAVTEVQSKRTKKAKKYGPKRLGAKRVKNLERLESAGEILNSEEATGYRALAARSNYLTLDRPDTAFTTTELCRDFEMPTRDSVERLKHLVRYLAHHKRLVWCFNFQGADDSLKCFVDTDFAGCQRTRRSTWGG